MKVKLTIIESACRSGYHKKGDLFVVEDICPPLCHELWHSIYPSICILQNGGDLDFGSQREKQFIMKCPDNGRVVVKGELLMTDIDEA